MGPYTFSKSIITKLLMKVNKKMIEDKFLYSLGKV